MTAEEYRAILEQEADGKKRLRQEEGSLQIRCVKIFRASFPMLTDCMTHMKNEEPDAKRRKIGAAMGVVAGYPDLMLFLPARYGKDIYYCGLAIELKNGKKGRQGINQKLCQMRMEASGYKYVLVRDTDEFAREASDYINHIPKDVTAKLVKVMHEINKIREEEQRKAEANSIAKARKELQAMLNKGK